MGKIRLNPLITCQENDKCIWVFNLPFAGVVKVLPAAKLVVFAQFMTLLYRPKGLA